MQKTNKTALLGYILMLILTAVVPIIFQTEQLQALIIFPIILIFAHLAKMNSKEIGLVAGTWEDYLIGFLYPFLICVAIIILVIITGNLGTVHCSAELPGKVVTLFFMTLILAVATEEGFFRGWLFGILERGKMNPQLIIILTALAFSLWHFPLFLMDPGFAWSMLPLYLGGGVIAGMIFGLFRYRSGSIIVSSFSHALWNTTVYTLFGVGSSIGILGIQMTNVFGPESGLLGMVFSIAFIAVLWWWTFKK
ncbi:MAG: CPBP family intramembrane metalloprotease [Methanobacteriaceae archaeon]|nr:CPBP family intramembrane metalloprotease [Methanobacteriaceae archaeon]